LNNKLKSQAVDFADKAGNMFKSVFKTAKIQFDIMQAKQNALTGGLESADNLLKSWDKSEK
jgi:hypothetical protein